MSECICWWECWKCESGNNTQRRNEINLIQTLPNRAHKHGNNGRQQTHKERERWLEGKWRWANEDLCHSTRAKWINGGKQLCKIHLSHFQRMQLRKPPTRCESGCEFVHERRHACALCNRMLSLSQSKHIEWRTESAQWKWNQCRFTWTRTVHSAPCQPFKQYHQLFPILSAVRGRQCIGCVYFVMQSWCCAPIS